MMSIIVVGVLFLMAAAVDTAQSASSCGFSIVHTAPQQVPAAGPPEVVSRTRLMRQPDSPVIVTSVDFTGTAFEVGEGWYANRLRSRFEVMNVSDREVRDVRIAVHVRSITVGGVSGTGSGNPPVSSLAPGARTMVDVSGGNARGSGHRGGIFVDVSVESMILGECIYRPSQLLPITAR